MFQIVEEKYLCNAECRGIEMTVDQVGKSLIDEVINSNTLNFFCSINSLIDLLSTGFELFVPMLVNSFVFACLSEKSGENLVGLANLWTKYWMNYQSKEFYSYHHF